MCIGVVKKAEKGVAFEIVVIAIIIKERYYHCLIPHWYCRVLNLHSLWPGACHAAWVEVMLEGTQTMNNKLATLPLLRKEVKGFLFFLNTSAKLDN